MDLRVVWCYVGEHVGQRYSPVTIVKDILLPVLYFYWTLLVQSVYQFPTITRFSGARSSNFYSIYRPVLTVAN